MEMTIGLMQLINYNPYFNISVQNPVHVVSVIARIVTVSLILLIPTKRMFHMAINALFNELINRCKLSGGNLGNRNIHNKNSLKLIIYSFNVVDLMPKSVKV